MPPLGYTRRAEEDSPGPSSAKRRRFDTQSEASASETGRSLPRRIPSHSSSRGSDSGDEGRTRESGSESSSDEDGEGEDDYSDSEGNWSYELVVVQHPQRARACGFGDKDRRPLSPPPILRLYIRTSTGRLVHPSKINIQTLLVMVDLWSIDLTQQRNVVTHPATTSARPTSPALDTTPLAEAERRSQLQSESRLAASEDRPPSSHYPAAGWGWPEAKQSEAPASTKSDPSPHTVNAQATLYDHLPVPSTPPQPSSSFSHSRPASSPLPIYQNSHTTSLSNQSLSQRPRTSPSTILRPLSHSTPERRASINLPSLSSITENLPSDFPSYASFDISRDPTAQSSPFTTSGRPRTSTSEWTRESNRPSWSTESTRPPTDYSFGRSSTSTWNTSSFSSEGVEKEKPHITGWPPPSSFSEVTRPFTSGGPPQPVSRDPYLNRPSTSGQSWSTGEPNYTSIPPPKSSQISRLPSHLFPPDSIAPHPLPPEITKDEGSRPDMDEDSEEEDDDEEFSAASFSRVLVGSVCAMCQRLKDETGQEGLFFFTPDLAVRTEGVFRLKFSISDVSSVIQIGPSAGSGSAILAQAYSEPFTVYSAKKFPGVIPTTRLTSLFAGQNVKLPTRHKRRSEVEAGGEEVDEG